jgi:hypothetical protein
MIFERGIKNLILRCQAEYPPIWEIEEKVMLGRNLTEKPTMADVTGGFSCQFRF